MKEYNFKNIGLNDTGVIIDKILEYAKPGFTVGLIGNLGAGKTYLASGVLKRIGINSITSSPTFTLLNQYEIGDKEFIVNHFDMYRISSAEELESAGYFDYAGDKNCFNMIEWADKIMKYLPKKKLVIMKIDYSEDIIKRDYNISEYC
ncbi:MAG TPA: tRNA (adenosine(37)-N6)-threonylcarbamoyltransferase complex ATPase subunit type 1 TsaE [bacterium]|nr:tRNA (adenosine(37)-N6)-threonylcarbamoyltransferase complex ATPase subunit type 1 TsaE [bacterium]